MKDMGPCNRYRYEEKICTEEGKGVSVVKERERRGARIHTRTTEEKIYPTLKVTLNSTSVLCRKEEW